jgi:LUD domain
MEATVETILAPNPVYACPASVEQIERTAQALEANGIHAIVAEDGEAARQAVLDLLPAGAEVYTARSKTLELLGLETDINTSGRFEAVRPRAFSLDRQTQMNEIRALIARPAFVVGSVHAVTEAGQVLVASSTGSQLGPYAGGAGKVIWVAGAQKIVKDLDEGLRRIQEYSYPLEDARIRSNGGGGTGVNKLLIVNREWKPGRSTLILVKEVLGF